MFDAAAGILRGMTYRKELLELARLYAAARILSRSRIATLCRNDGKFFDRIERGGGCTVDTFLATKLWFSERWPIEIEWPADILRPN